MIRRILTPSMLIALLLTTPTLAQDTGQAPEMTPEQKAEMEAYMKAGTPGAPHKATGGDGRQYDVKVKSWHEPGGPATEETGTATRTMALDGRVLVEEFNGSMMGMPFTGHGMTGLRQRLRQVLVHLDRQHVHRTDGERRHLRRPEDLHLHRKLQRPDQEGPGEDAHDQRAGPARRPRSSRCTVRTRTARR